MEKWKITYISGAILYAKIIESDPYNLFNNASNAGCDIYNIIRIERILEADLRNTFDTTQL